MGKTCNGMTIETPVEYYYGETLRWSFGFENPNKAAVLFACVIPLLWYLWQRAWKLNGVWLKILLLLVSAGTLIVAWRCLIMTFSRGGLVAAVVGLIYLIGYAVWYDRKITINRCRSVESWVSFLLIISLVGMTFWNGLGHRSSEALGQDASVGNRVELWHSALQMAAENLHGFGTGKSGEQYMQWYQPIERQESYRTMVNSYLTFLVEEGWLAALAALIVFGLFWVWTRPAKNERLVVGLRGSILAFLVAGIFSTTMEEGRLWIVPAACITLLTGLAIFKKKRLSCYHLWICGGSIFLGCGVLLALGWLRSGKDPLRRVFSKVDGGRTVTAFGPKTDHPRALGCVVDEAVLGKKYAKLLRELALAGQVKILLGECVNQADRILLMGKSVHEFSHFPNQSLWLLAPEKVELDELKALVARTEPIQLLMPDMDQDGRVSFWDEAAEGAMANRFTTTSLSGVGNRVDWAWQQIVAIIRDMK
jgi:O-Antigen ligase